MNSNTYKIIGSIFLVSSGLIYSFERFTSTISTSIIKAGFFSGQMNGEVPQVATAGLFDNFFVLLFIILGFASLIYGIKKDR